MTKLFLVRHGQTDWNAQNRIQGRADIPLNSTGVMQAEALCKKVHEQAMHFDAIYSSPLLRTSETAQIIAGDDANVLYDARLLERDVGDFEGKPTGELFNHSIDFLDPKLNAGDFGVEPILEFQDRIRSFIRDLRQKYPQDAQILCVTSNGFMKRFAKIIGQTNIPDFKNGEIYECEI